VYLFIVVLLDFFCTTRLPASQKVSTYAIKLFPKLTIFNLFHTREKSDFKYTEINTDNTAGTSTGNNMSLVFGNYTVHNYFPCFA